MPESVWIGFQMQHITPRPDFLKASHLTKIASVSTCIAPQADPLAHSEPWNLNAWGLRDAPEMLPNVADTMIRAYKLIALRFDADGEHDLPISDVIAPPDHHFVSIGWDAVSRSVTPFFECSPLSCNGLVDEADVLGFAVNEHCLFKTCDDAMRGARVFAAGRGEPGPYYVLEVFERAEPHSVV
jgi:hypothetical protein